MDRIKDRAGGRPRVLAIVFLACLSGIGTSPASAQQAPADPAPATEARAPMLRAKAGADLVGAAGSPVTLNGGQSEPRGRIGYRWIQAGGVQVTSKLESGCYYTFVPPSAGIYQFALVVASGDKISEPDYLTVTIEASAPEAAPVAAAAPVAPRPATPPPPPPTTSELTSVAVRSIEGGPELAPDLVRIFSDIATRMNVFKTYEEAFSEMSRRLDDLIPKAPADRAAWTEKLFVPLTSRMVEGLRAEGLDLARPEGPSAALSTAQRRRLATHFRSMADGFGRVNEGPSGPERLDVQSGRRPARDAVGLTEEPK